MNVTDIVATAVATLIVLVLAHLAVYWVVKTLYPPSPLPRPMPEPEPERRVAFVEPPREEHVERVVLPTYEASPAKDTAPEAGERRGPPPAESTSIRGDSRVAAA